MPMYDTHIIIFWNKEAQVKGARSQTVLLPTNNKKDLLCQQIGSDRLKYALDFAEISDDEENDVLNYNLHAVSPNHTKSLTFFWLKSGGLKRLNGKECEGALRSRFFFFPNKCMCKWKESRNYKKCVNWFLTQ